ncbi:MAG: GTP cyclohydrolase I FolE [Verrucomicrobia bacterium]|nr:GTP cyclohydrolase I FolE [Verrucomicrobiota bacterium]
MSRIMKAELIKKLLKEIGEDPERQGLLDTPERCSEAWDFLTRGYRQNIADVINEAVFDVDANHMIIVRDIEIYSLCEHHMLPFFGRCHIGYIPNGKVLGVSKLARIADVFARRLQLQERLTNQIAETIMEALEPDGVGVVIEAQHLCMMMRGVEKQNSNMVTSAMLGSFRSHSPTRMEFLSLIGHESFR